MNRPVGAAEALAIIIAAAQATQDQEDEHGRDPV